MLRPTTGVFFRRTVVDVAAKANFTSPPSVSAKIPAPAHAAAEVLPDQPNFFLKPVVLAAAATSIPGALRAAVIKGPSTATAHPSGSLPPGAHAPTARPGGPLHVRINKAYTYSDPPPGVAAPAGAADVRAAHRKPRATPREFDSAEERMATKVEGQI